MNPETFTHKTNEALAAARETAAQMGHAQILPAHVFLALLKDPAGLARQAVAQAAGADAGGVEAVEKAIKDILSKQPSQSPPPDEVRNMFESCVPDFPLSAEHASAQVRW
jgi:ATP-dependent Clp protease ATP-binding subunit ClpB